MRTVAMTISKQCMVSSTYSKNYSDFKEISPLFVLQEQLTMDYSGLDSRAIGFETGKLIVQMPALTLHPPPHQCL